MSTVSTAAHRNTVGTSKTINSLDDSDDLYMLNFLRCPIAIHFDDDILHVDPFRDNGMRIPVLRPIPQFKSRIIIAFDDLLVNSTKTVQRRYGC